MASIGMINIGGKDNPAVDISFNSSVVFFLKSACKVDKVFYFQNKQWEVEVKSGTKSIVARSRHKLSIDKILSRGLELCQQSLDLLSVERNGEFHINSPGEEYIILFIEENEVVLREVSFTDLSISVEASFTIVDKEGKTIPEPTTPQISWISAFRFYRLSQGSSDLFEAYRNLFLGLEAILNQIYPKKADEKEKQWLKRTLGLVSNKIQISEIIKDVDDPVEHFIVTQYENIRCKLFHAKGDRAIIPHQDLNPISITDAYKELLMIWRKIASFYFNVTGGGGVITHQGFQSMMDAGFKNGFSFIASNDNTQLTKDDTEINTNSTDIYSYDYHEYKNGSSAGQVLLKGSMDKINISKVKVIYKTGVKVDDIIYSIHFIPDGLYIKGIDRFESHQIYRLINKGMPKSIF